MRTGGPGRQSGRATMPRPSVLAMSATPRGAVPFGLRRRRPLASLQGPRRVSNRPSALRLACGRVVAFHASIADRVEEPRTVRARGHRRDHRRYQIDPLRTSAPSESGHSKSLSACARALIAAASSRTMQKRSPAPAVRGDRQSHTAAVSVCVGLYASEAAKCGSQSANAAVRRFP